MSRWYPDWWNSVVSWSGGFDGVQLPCLLGKALRPCTTLNFERVGHTHCRPQLAAWTVLQKVIVGLDFCPNLFIIVRNNYWIRLGPQNKSYCSLWSVLTANRAASSHPNYHHRWQPALTNLSISILPDLTILWSKISKQLDWRVAKWTVTTNLFVISLVAVASTMLDVGTGLEVVPGKKSKVTTIIATIFFRATTCKLVCTDLW